MVIVKVPENRVSEILNEFCSKSTFTFEGIDVSGKNGAKFKKEFEKIARSTGFNKKDLIGYKFSGKDMNETYHLEGSNAYPNDLTFISIPDYYNPLVKLNVGARWFDDIVANNTIRQNAVTFSQSPDYL